MLVTLYKIGEVHFPLLGTNGSHAKANNERLTAAGLRCRPNLKTENFRSSFGRLRQQNSPKNMPHVQQGEIIDLWRCPCRCRRHFFNSLLLDNSAGRLTL